MHFQSNGNKARYYVGDPNWPTDVVRVTPGLVTFPGKVHSVKVTVRDENGQVLNSTTRNYTYGAGTGRCVRFRVQGG